MYAVDNGKPHCSDLCYIDDKDKCILTLAAEWWITHEAFLPIESPFLLHFIIPPHHGVYH